MSGHNQMTPFEEVADEIERLFARADAVKGVSTQGEADAVGTLINDIRAAAKRAGALRKEEVLPIDEEKAKVQAKYAPLIADTKGQKGKAVLALEALKNALTPWLRKLDEQKRAAVEKARLEAEERQRVAREAFQAAQSLEDRERAESLNRKAQEAEKSAKRAEKQTTTAAGGVGRAVHLRTRHVAEVVDMAEFARWAWVHCREDLEAWFTAEAQRQVDLGRRDIPGVEVREQKDVT